MPVKLILLSGSCYQRFEVKYCLHHQGKPGTYTGNQQQTSIKESRLAWLAFKA
jgi:hypothetical protein